LIDGLARVLGERTRLPRTVAMPLAIVLIVAMFGLAIWLVAHNGKSFAADAPLFSARTDRVLQQISGRTGLDIPPTFGNLMEKLNPAHWVGVVATAAREIIEQSIFVLIYLGFLLASQHGFGRKIGMMLDSNARQQEVARVMERVRRGIESYVFVQTVVGVVIAALSVLIMWPLGLQHVFFFAFVIFLTNYVPAIGAAVGVLLPPLFGLLEFDDLWRPIALLVGLEAVHFGVSHVLQPRLQGQKLNLDPIFVLVGLAFWSYLWGLTGAFLSTPLTVAVMAVLAETKSARWAAVLLSSDGRPFADEPAPPGPPRPPLSHALRPKPKPKSKPTSVR
jgi:AI-2 transport protein TqsA